LILYSHIRGHPRSITRELNNFTTQITPNTYYYTYNTRSYNLIILKTSFPSQWTINIDLCRLRRRDRLQSAKNEKCYYKILKNVTVILCIVANADHTSLSCCFYITTLCLDKNLHTNSQVRSSHIYLYSAFHNTDCIKAASN